jgi:hypothetical protein
MAREPVPLTRPVAPVTSIAQSGQAVITAVQELLQVYQAMARRKGERLTASVKVLSAAKTPTESAAAANDCAAIDELTATAFEPTRKPIERASKP